MVIIISSRCWKCDESHAISGDDIFNNYHERELDMRWQMGNEARSAELAIAIQYPTSASGIIVLLKTPKQLQYLSYPAVFVDAYRLPYLL